MSMSITPFKIKNIFKLLKHLEIGLGNCRVIIRFDLTIASDNKIFVFIPKVVIPIQILALNSIRITG